MPYRRMGEGVRVTVPATTANLGPGFDAMALALRLHLTLSMSLREPSCQDVAFVGTCDSRMARTGCQLVRTAARRGLRLARLGNAGYSISVKSDIPAGGGLGSSAALRVACLLACSHLGTEVPRSALLSEALDLEGHADNAAAALEGGLVVVAPMRGEPEWLKVRVPAFLIAVVATPAATAVTAESRAGLPQTITRADAVFNLSRASLLVGAIAAGRCDLLDAAMQDRLHQPFRLPLLPGTGEAMEAARQAGALGAALSGSGPSVVALADRRRGDTSAIAHAMQTAFAHAGMRTACVVLPPDRRGARVRALTP